MNQTFRHRYKVHFKVHFNWLNVSMSFPIANAIVPTNTESPSSGYLWFVRVWLAFIIHCKLNPRQYVSCTMYENELIIISDWIFNDGIFDNYIESWIDPQLSVSAIFHISKLSHSYKVQEMSQKSVFWAGLHLCRPSTINQFSDEKEQLICFTISRGTRKCAVCFSILAFLGNSYLMFYYYRWHPTKEYNSENIFFYDVGMHEIIRGMHERCAGNHF